LGGQNSNIGRQDKLVQGLQFQNPVATISAWRRTSDDKKKRALLVAANTTGFYNARVGRNKGIKIVTSLICQK
jgi:hypothetical protein